MRKPNLTSRVGLFMELVLICTLAVFYGLWLLLTLVRAAGHDALVRLRVPRQLWALLPNWSLFAPKPSLTDHYVFYRDQRGEAEPGPWVLAYGPEPRKWYHGFWNPNKVQAKAVFDLNHQLARVVNEIKEGGEEAVVQSAPYQHLMHFVRQLPRPEAQDQTQFCIVLREPAHNYEATLLASPMYPL